MKDLTTGSVTRQLLEMAAPISASVIAQILYYLVDLYFVARLGSAAVSGVTAAGAVILIAMALMDVLVVAIVTLIAHAAGRQDAQEVNVLFNQAVSLCAACAVATAVASYTLGNAYVAAIAADEQTAAFGSAYIRWFIPGLLITQIVFVPLSAALRGMGTPVPALIAQLFGLVVHLLLAPILIAGWFTQRPLGVVGAALASAIAMVCSSLLLVVYFIRKADSLSLAPRQWRPHWPQWRRMVSIGLPLGADRALTLFGTTLVFWLIRDFGPAAQAGFAVGTRVLQVIAIPLTALAYAAVPLAGQNFGARKYDRVRETFRRTFVICLIIALVTTLLAQLNPRSLVAPFSEDPQALAAAMLFMQIMCWSLLAHAVICTNWALFRAIGHTWPALLTAGARLVLFAVAGAWLSTLPSFDVAMVWWLLLASLVLQALLGLKLLNLEFAKRLWSPTLRDEKAGLKNSPVS